jgi:hypothetical protein
MKKVVSLIERIESKKHKSELRQYHEKIAVIKKITQCSSCCLKCLMCGQYLDEENYSPDNETEREFILCDNCNNEFKDFLALCHGEERKQVPWHNREWKNMWAIWLRYQKAIAGFKNSSEFKELMEKLTT